METIKAYVENVFRSLPDTDAIRRAKEEILNNMLDKYNELKANGKSEHEAVGIVISEFGNIDELLEEMNLLPSKDQLAEKEDSANVDTSLRLMSLTEVKEYITAYARSAKVIALGVLLCIVGVSALIFFTQLSEDGIFSTGLLADGDDIFGLIVMFGFVAVAVALFIIGGMSLNKFEYVSKGIRLDNETAAFLEARKSEIQPSFTRNLIIGVVMCVLSPMILFAGFGLFSDDSAYPVAPFLLFIAVGVYILVRNGMRFASLTTLLTEYRTTPQERKSDSLTGSLCGVIMLIATTIYLYFGFVESNWNYAPAIYAIGGILCGIVAIIVNAVTEARKR